MNTTTEKLFKGPAELAQDVTEAGREIWRAGLGAFARAEKSGRKTFDRLVEKGRKVEKKQFKAIDKTVAQTSKKVQEFSSKAQESVENGMTHMLHRFGLATLDDLEALSRHVEELSKKVDEALASPRV
ncbi:MAG: phasin family protein [Acidobacteriota bacterium]